MRTHTISDHSLIKGVSWDSTVNAMSPWAWWKLDDGATSTVIADSSGNNRTGSYPNGTFTSYPLRQQAGLISGSVYSLKINGSGNNEVWAPDPFPANLFGSGSWTYGAIIKTTTTTGLQYYWSVGSYRHTANFNFNWASHTTEVGTVSMSFDAGGTNANALNYTSSGWNDGTAHLWFFEYDSVADTISIWKDGAKVATKARAGTKPTAANTYTAGAQLEFSKSGITPNAALYYDEILFFNKVLTSAEHLALNGAK